ncbi:YcnI family copper-binding membrane protein [Kutzneria chonburiensis]|uniref:YcnI family protein n=1 Tax=Kutzneria chonburiensis TaxID=1483604 RepID=A0ABV6MNB6_9PSEU|nr:YcnI family protein [Kutzneria chonburiensis]
MSLRSSSRALTRIGAIATVTLATGLLGAGIAAAHVETEPGQATKGDESTITFRVPNEEDSAGVVKLEVSFPLDHPVPEANTTPIPGWTAKVTKTTLPAAVHQNNSDVKEAVQTVTWTADPGTQIKPGEFLRFPVLAGPLADNTDKLTFKAVQTYSNGDVVRWIDPPAAEGAQEPEHPAPTITLVSDSADSPAKPAEAAPASTSDSTARWLGGAGLVVGILGLALGIAIAARGRRAAPSATKSTVE